MPVGFLYRSWKARRAVWEWARHRARPVCQFTWPKRNRVRAPGACLASSAHESVPRSLQRNTRPFLLVRHTRDLAGFSGVCLSDTGGLPRLLPAPFGLPPLGHNFDNLALLKAQFLGRVQGAIDDTAVAEHEDRAFKLSARHAAPAAEELAQVLVLADVKRLLGELVPLRF